MYISHDKMKHRHWRVFARVFINTGNIQYKARSHGFFMRNRTAWVMILFSPYGVGGGLCLVGTATKFSLTDL
jgi:hypothetical protein